jgi:hypothetical protein
MEQNNQLGPDIFRKKFERFNRLKEELGEEGAWKKMFEGYPERQKETMGPFIENCTLAKGFSKAIPIYKQIGMEMEIVDISNKGVDAVLEIQKVCPALSYYQEYGFDKPCKLICEMDGRASHQAFPELKGEILCTQAEGACTCVFKYERKIE